MLKSNIANTAKAFLQKDESIYLQRFYKTGFDHLDKVMSGGFSAGVHYIGAGSSIGKSTFAIQMADNMARFGYQVFFFSLEMNAVDITAKLISSHSYRISKRSGNTNLAKTVHQLRSLASVSSFSDEEQHLITEAAETVSAHSSNLTVFENDEDPITVDDIYEYVKQNYIPNNTVVFIDYLQILALSRKARGYTEKQTVDYNISVFRSIASVFKIPVIIISSCNRDNYDKPVSFNSFKESGNIEYSADTLMGFQFSNVGKKDYDVFENKKADTRLLDLVILKNRMNKASVKIPYLFLPRYNFFEEKETRKETGRNPEEILKERKRPERKTERI